MQPEEGYPVVIRPRISPRGFFRVRISTNAARVRSVNARVIDATSLIDP